MSLPSPPPPSRKGFRLRFRLYASSFAGSLNAVIVSSLAMLVLPACGGNDEASLVPKRVSNEQALTLIRSCEVTRLLALHSGEVDLTLEDGRRVFVTRPETTRLSEAAVNASLERGCDIAVGME
jgi:hypothetical protein